MAIMLMIRITPIVEPIPQFWVTRKCCSTAVPKVMTRFPPISRVSMNSDRRRNEDGLETAAHAAQRQRKDDPRQSLHPCCAQVLAGYDQGRVQLFDRIEDRQDHERQLDVSRHENETEVREQDLLGTDAHEAQELIDRPTLTEQTDEGIGLQQEIDPCRQNDQGQPELLMLRPAQEQRRRVTDQERHEGNDERIQERIKRHPQIISRAEIGRVVGKCEMLR